MCAVTGCATEQVLEAVHITPYLGKQTNHLTNGLLLRSDLHTLFDLGLIGVAPSTFELLLSPSLRNSDYARYSGRRISVPVKSGDQPGEKALKQHLTDFGWTV
jgi:putative restriction endonuclease